MQSGQAWNTGLMTGDDNKMDKISWDEFYSNFFELSQKSQKICSQRLLNFGPPDQVFEVAYALSLLDKDFAGEFLNTALDAGVRFTPEDVIDCTIFSDKQVVKRMADSTTDVFTTKELCELKDYIDDPTYEHIKNEHYLCKDQDCDLSMAERKQGNEGGFFSSLFAGLKKRHEARK